MTEQGSKTANYPLMAILVTLNVINFVDRNLIVSLSAYIVPDLDLNNTEYGLLTGFVFLFFYSLAGLFMGILSDRVNRIKLMAGAVFLWSALTALSGAARGFVSLAVPRAFIGVGESAVAPSSLSLLADSFPSSRLGFASSIFFLGIPLGSGLSFIIAGQIAPIAGWRACFYGLGLIGVLLTGCLFFFRDPVRQESAKAEAGEVRTILLDLARELRRNRGLVMLILGAVFMNLAIGSMAFDQLWLIEERGFERAQIAGITGWFIIVSGTIGTLYGAYGMDFCLRRFRLSRARFLFWTLLALAPLSILYRVSPADTAWFWIGFSGAYFFFGAVIGPFFAVVQDFTPPRVRGTVIALTILVSNIIGLGLGNYVTGAAVDWLILQNANQPYSSVLVVVTGLSYSCLIFYYLAGHEKSRD